VVFFWPGRPLCSYLLVTHSLTNVTDVLLHNAAINVSVVVVVVVVADFRWMTDYLATTG